MLVVHGSALQLLLGTARTELSAVLQGQYEVIGPAVAGRWYQLQMLAAPAAEQSDDSRHRHRRTCQARAHCATGGARTQQLLF